MLNVANIGEKFEKAAFYMGLGSFERCVDCCKYLTTCNKSHKIRSQILCCFCDSCIFICVICIVADSGVVVNPKLIEGLESTSIRSITTCAHRILVLTRMFAPFVRTQFDRVSRVHVCCVQMLVNCIRGVTLGQPPYLRPLVCALSHSLSLFLFVCVVLCSFVVKQEIGK